MTLQASGAISAAQLNTELGRASDSTISIGNATERDLADVASGAVSFDNFYSKTRATVSVASTSGTGAGGGYLYVNYNVAANCTTSGAWASGGIDITVTRMSNTQYRFYAPGYSGLTLTGTYRVTANPNSGGISAAVDRAITVTQYLELLGASCFPAGSMVAMADGTYKPIEQIQIGEWVKTAVGVAQVTHVEMPLLGNRPFFEFEDGKCRTSGEHSLWSRDPMSMEQWWATRDIIQWRVEGQLGKGPTFGGHEPFDLTDLVGMEWDFATENGWKRTAWRFVEDAHPDIQLYHLYVDKGGSYFVDGYLVSSIADTGGVDWESFSWGE